MPGTQLGSHVIEIFTACTYWGTKLDFQRSCVYRQKWWEELKKKKCREDKGMETFRGSQGKHSQCVLTRSLTLRMTSYARLGGYVKCSVRLRLGERPLRRLRLSVVPAARLVYVGHCCRAPESSIDDVRICEISFACLMCLPLSQPWPVTTCLRNRVFSR